MNRLTSRLFVTVLLFSVPLADAHAFWWLLRGSAARGAAATATRGAAGAGIASESAGAIASTRPLAGSARFCVRPAGSAACDFRSANNAGEAARNAVGPSYRLRQTNSPSVFEVLDAVGNVISIIEAIDSDSDRNIAVLPQYAPPIAGSTAYGSGPEVNLSTSQLALRHDGAFLYIQTNGRPTLVWSDGYVEVWGDNNPQHVVLPPGGPLRFVNINTIFAVPRSSDASSLYVQPANE